MKDQFVRTKNVTKFQHAVDHIHHKLKGVERMVLIFGDPGLGKTETALHYSQNNGSLMIRTKKLMTARWLLAEVVEELGGAPSWRTRDLFNQSTQLLSSRRKTLILDEVDYFTQDSKVIETLRDLHDITHCPMVFIGMNNADKRLMRYPHLYDRFVEVVKFEPLDHEDVQQMTKELSEVNFEEDAIERVTEESEGKIRKIIAMIHRAEAISRSNRTKSISAKDFK